MSNPQLEKIDHPETRAKLTGMQEVASDMGSQVMKLHGDMQQKKGVVAAAGMLAKRILDECGPIQHEVDAEKMEPAEAKIRIDQIQKIVKIVSDIEQINRDDINVIRGRMEGMKHATDLVEKRFNNEVAKHERHKRMFEDDEEDDLRSIPEDDSSGDDADDGNGKWKDEESGGDDGAPGVDDEVEEEE